MSSRIEELVRDLASETEDVRKAAVVWLAQMRDPSTLPHLAKLVEDPSPAVRYFARRAVEELKVRPALEKVPLSAEGILANLASPERGQRIAAAMACYALHDPQLLPHLLKALDGEKDLHVIATLVKAIGAQRDPQVIPRLVHLLHHTDARVRSNTVDATMLLDDADVLDAVSLLAADVSNRVRSSVALFLAHRDPARVQSMVREMIDTDLLWMKDSAVYVMHAVGAPWCLDYLEEMAKREDPAGAIGRKCGIALNHLKAKLGGSTEDPAQLSGTVTADTIAQMRAELAKGAPPPPPPPPQPQISEAERQGFTRLGTMAFSQSRIGDLAGADLIAQADKIAKLGATLDRGQKLASTLAEREAELVTLGRMVLGAARDGKLENEALVREAQRVEEQIEGKPPEPVAAGEEPAPEAPKGRVTLKEQIVTTDMRGRPTMRQAAVANTRRSQAVPGPVVKEAWGAWVARNKLLIAPAALVVLVVAGVAIGVSGRAGDLTKKFIPKVFKGPTHFEPPVKLEEILASKAPASFKGRRVRWSGVVRERSPGSSRVVIESGKHEFVAEFDMPPSDQVVEDAQAEVDGVVESVAAKVVNVKGQGITATPLSTFEKREREKAKKKRRR